jgi:hypothetical protein
MGLQPATWYRYRVESSTQVGETTTRVEPALLQCFRTLDPLHAGTTLRLAYGSCRKASATEPDALSALGSWLLQRLAERESLWPRMLLLIGDQIYADDPPGSQARSFEEFADRYVQAWTADGGVRQVLAALPAWMIFDDHEITNNWNITPAWRTWALQRGMESMLIDGLLAYWLYQGWGNCGMCDAHEDTLLTIMQQAAHSGEDALELLRARIRRAIYSEKALQWDYTIATMPPIFVADVRADRPAALDGVSYEDHSARIMSQEQMARLRNWMQAHEQSTAVLVSSVPALLPPAIGFAEYLMGVRPLQGSSGGRVHQLGHLLAKRQQRTALRMGFEHWPVFHATWRELLALGTRHRRDIVILSGDVHFSYAMRARPIFGAGRRQATFYQLVSSPFKNTLAPRERRLVRAQSWLRRAFYSNLALAVLPLVRKDAEKYASTALLLQNVVALVTFCPQAQNEGAYTIRQVYLGVQSGTLQEIAAITPGHS